MKKLKVGVIGLGHNGLAFCERYAKNPKTTLVAVCDVNSFDGLGEKWMDIPSVHDKSHDYMPEIDHIAECILNGKKCLVTPREGAKASIAGLYAMQSAYENKVLQIPDV